MTYSGSHNRVSSQATISNRSRNRGVETFMNPTATKHFRLHTAAHSVLMTVGE
jgi:hypothetical protein